MKEKRERQKSGSSQKTEKEQSGSQKVDKEQSGSSQKVETGQAGSSQTMEKDKCVICLQDLETLGLGRQTLACGHTLHEECVLEMRRLGASGCCPICREAHSDLLPMQQMLDQAIWHYSFRSYEKSIALLQQVLELQPDNAWACQLMGEFCMMGKGCAKDLERARDFFEDAHRQGHPQATHNLGLLHHNQANLSQAQEMYEQARSKGVREAITNLGNLHEALGNLEKAQELYKEGSLKGCTSADVHLGCLYTNMGKMKEARNAFEKAHNQGNEKGTVNLGLHYQKQGDVKMAEKMFEQARRKGSLAGTFGLGKLHEEQGNVRKAQEMYEEGYRRGDARAAFKLGHLHSKQGRIKQALEIYEQARLLGSKEAVVNLGMLYKRTGHIKKAQEMYEEACQHGDPDAFFNLGNLFNEIGNFEKARESYEDAYRLGSVDAKGAIGCLFVQSGMRLEGQKMLEQAYFEGDALAGEILNGKIGGLGHFKRIPRGNVEWANNQETHTTFKKKFATGMQVQIINLISQPGRLLSGLVGTVVDFRASGGRVGVRVGVAEHLHADEVGTLLAVKMENLIPCDVLPKVQNDSEIEFPYFNAPLLLDPEELSAQTAIQESSSIAAASAQECQPIHDANSKVSEDLLRTGAEQGLYLVLLKFTRSPQAFREALMESPELAEVRDKLQSSGLNVELASGAKVFVEPDHYEAMLEAVRLGNWNLYPEHVIVDPTLETTVIEIVRKLHGKYKVYSKSSDVVPLGFSMSAAQTAHPIQVSKTFISIKLPSSLKSSSEHAGARTASTTDADARKGKNVRKL